MSPNLCESLDDYLVVVASDGREQRILSRNCVDRTVCAVRVPWVRSSSCLTKLSACLPGRPLIPPPRFHMIRYHGVLAARAAARAEIVPGRAPAPVDAQLPLFMPSDLPLEPPPPPSRHPWPWLLKRVFAVEIETCPVPGCGGRMRLVEIATEPDDIARVVAAVDGAAPRAPPRRPRPSPPGQLRLAFG